MPTNLSYPLLSQPLVDQRGYMARPWQQFFEALAIRVGADRAMTNLELEDAGNATQGTLSAQLAAQAALLTAQTAALEAQQLAQAFSVPPAALPPVERVARVPLPPLPAPATLPWVAPPEGRTPPALALWGQEGALVRDLLARVHSLESLGTPTTGSWTPVLEGDGTAGTQGYSVQVGSYWHWQGLLYATFHIVLSSTSGMAGNVHIAGLPATSLNVTNVAHAAMFTTYNLLNFSAGYTQLTGQLPANNTRIFLIETGDNLTGQFVQAAAIAATSAVVGGVLYRT